ncbi:MAG: hypothetical protein GPJ51_01795 [Candidatus Heimdallarchaeota archaeon]|nr:hypothetical protein [Candidatus Heimdallarchaeota archaeon]
MNSSHSNCEYVEVKISSLQSPELAIIIPNPTDVDTIFLDWDDVEGATEYYIYRSTSYIWSVEGLILIDTVVSSSYIDTLLAEGDYFYVIVATDGITNSTHSNCEYVHYEVPHLREFAITTSLLLGVIVISLFILRRRRKK